MAGLGEALRLPKSAQEVYAAEAETAPLSAFPAGELADLALQRYGRLLPLCESFAADPSRAIGVFSGKDLLLAMAPALQELLKYDSSTMLMEAVIVGIENSAEAVWTWLPEWTALREVIRAA